MRGWGDQTLQIIVNIIEFLRVVSENLIYVRLQPPAVSFWKINVPVILGAWQTFLHFRVMEPIDRFPGSLRSTKPVNWFAGLKPKMPMMPYASLVMVCLGLCAEALCVALCWNL